MSITAKENSRVTIHYTGKLDDGTVFDSSVGKQPLSFTIGGGKIIKGFEDGVMGMSVGEEKDLLISPEDAYGPHRHELVQKVPREELGELVPTIGMVLALKIPGNEQVFPARIIDLDEESITLDLNPPLAGKTLHFHIQLVSVEE